MTFLRDFLPVLAKPMAIVGIVGQTMFAMRFIIQWFVSERKRESTVPLAFWYFSVLGGMLTLVYALWRRDPVFSVAQASGLIVYARNLMLIHGKKKRDAVPAVEV
jgi:lipid-A-disaccharide synthase-like uncharacterized protein